MATPATITAQNLPTIVLVGRANVGKSTIFNRLIEKNKALVSTIAGTTRTNNEGDILWRGTQIHLIDTGGLESQENELFVEDILKQSESALRQADIIVMLTDAKIGILPQDKLLAKKLVSTYLKKIPVFLVANKADSDSIELNTHGAEWHKLGLGSPIPVSAANGRNLGDFLDLLYKECNKAKKRPKSIKENEEEICVTIMGKPNVGKSSLFNKLIGEEKVIVSPIAHTTREPFDTKMEYELNNKKHTITFIDTAGIRRKSNVSGFLERAGIDRSIQSIQKSDIVLLVIDGSEPISVQDKQLGGLLENKAKSCVILINKWDLADDNSDAKRNDVKRLIYAHFPHLSYAPILFISAKDGYKVHQVFPLLIQIAQARKTEIPQKELDEFMRKTVKTHMPSRGKGTKQPDIMGIHQINANPPVFEMLIKYRTSLHRSYINFVENQLRQQFDFTGTPLIIKLVKMKR